MSNNEQPGDLTVTFQITFTKEAQILLQSNSIERVINTSLKVLDAVTAEEIVDDAVQASQDWEALKWLTCRLWDTTRNAVFLEQQRQIPFGHLSIEADLIKDDKRITAIKHYRSRTGCSLGEAYDACETYSAEQQKS